MVWRYAACQGVASVVANEGLEDEVRIVAGNSLPSKDAMRRKTRLRDELFQDLMKVCRPATIIKAKAARIPILMT